MPNLVYHRRHPCFQWLLLKSQRMQQRAVESTKDEDNFKLDSQYAPMRLKRFRRFLKQDYGQKHADEKEKANLSESSFRV